MYLYVCIYMYVCMYIYKNYKSGTHINNHGISPVIRQSLLHWGYELRQDDADKYAKKKGLPKIIRPPGTKSK